MNTKLKILPLLSGNMTSSSSSYASSSYGSGAPNNACDWSRPATCRASNLNDLRNNLDNYAEVNRLTVVKTILLDAAKAIANDPSFKDIIKRRTDGDRYTFAQNLVIETHPFLPALHLAQYLKVASLYLGGRGDNNVGNGDTDKINTLLHKIRDDLPNLSSVVYYVSSVQMAAIHLPGDKIADRCDWSIPKSCQAIDANQMESNIRNYTISTKSRVSSNKIIRAAHKIIAYSGFVDMVPHNWRDRYTVAQSLAIEIAPFLPIVKVEDYGKLGMIWLGGRDGYNGIAY